MQQYLYFERKSTLLFTKIISSGIDFGKIRMSMVNFVKYVKDDYSKNMEMYKVAIPDMESINLEQVIDAKYRFMVRGKDLKAYVAFLNEVQGRMKDFKGKKDSNLKILLGMYFLYYVLIIKIVEVYFGTLASYEATPTTIGSLELKDIGIDKKILKYFEEFEEMREKTIDEWLAIEIDSVEEKYYLSALKRIFNILGSF